MDDIPLAQYFLAGRDKSPQREQLSDVAMGTADHQVDEKVKEPLSIDTSETETVSIDGDRLSIRSLDSSSTPTKPSSGLSTPTDKRSVTPPLGAPKRTPGSGGSHSKPPRASRETPGTPASHPNRPNRPGILWKINEKVEAMDFQKKWYPARIVDMDDHDNTALIHFDGWNQRYDEWMDMASDRLRPLARTSGRKEKKVAVKSQARLEHKLGDNVFAKWTDCRMYAGTIVGVNPNASYDVLFYDGFKKTVQPINIKPMPAAVQKEYASAGVLPHPHSRPPYRQERKGPPDEYKRIYTQSKSHERRISTDKRDGVDEGSTSVSRAPSTCSSTTTSPSATITRPSPTSSEKHKHKTSPDTLSKGSDGRPAPKRSKMAIGGTGQVKRIKSQSGKERDVQRKGGVSTEGVWVKKTERKLQTSKQMRRSLGHESTPRVKKDVHKTKLPSGPDEDESTDEDLMSLVDKSRPVGGQEVIPRVIKHPKQFPPYTEQSTLLQHSPSDARRIQQVEPEQFTCPFHNCNKSFRKLSLVEYHVKYYHTEDGSVVQPQPPRKRRKTLSVCSSDSEVSFSMRTGRTHKRRNDSVMSNMDMIADMSGVSVQDDMMTHDFSEVETHTTTTEDVDNKEAGVSYYEGPDGAMDALNNDELVNCICQLNEENGLMIQCDVCLCWQHAVCMELTEETLPTKYVCYVCTNPPGVRDSKRFSYDQDWLKMGTMARFNFLPEDRHANQKNQIMQATHNLVVDVHNVNGVLRSLSCQLHVSKDKDHAEVKFWTKNWDKVIEDNKAKLENPTIKTEQIEISDPSYLPKNQTTQETIIKQEVDTKSEAITRIERSDADKSDSMDQIPAAEFEDGEDVMLGPDGLVGNVSGAGQLSENASSSSLSSMRSVASESLQTINPSTSALSLPSQDGEVFAPVVPVQEEAFISCEQNLLHHISHMQDNAETRLDLLEEQIAALEGADDSGSGNNSSGGSDVLRDLPRVKKAVHQILNDLVKVKRMSLYR